MNDKWCLCRWTSAYTSMLLEHRDEKAGAVVRRESLHAERLVSMCGPLSAREPGWADDSSIEIHLGMYGFIDGGIGNVATWSTMEEAQAVVSAGCCGEQDWIKVDKAAPLCALEFRASLHSYDDGSTRELARGAFDSVRAEWALAKIAAKRTQKVCFHACPLWDRVGPYLPTAKESARMWDVCTYIDERPDSPPEAWRPYRSDAEKSMLAELRALLGVPVKAILGEIDDG